MYVWCRPWKQGFKPLAAARQAHPTHSWALGVGHGRHLQEEENPTASGRGHCSMEKSGQTEIPAWT